MAQKSRADKLKDLKMPARPMAEEEAEMDLAMEELPAMEGEELAEEGEDLADMPAEEEMAELEVYSDEELMEEMKRRGLMPEEEEEAEDEEIASTEVGNPDMNDDEGGPIV